MTKPPHYEFEHLQLLISIFSSLSCWHSQLQADIMLLDEVRTIDLRHPSYKRSGRTEMEKQWVVLLL